MINRVNPAYIAYNNLPQVTPKTKGRPKTTGLLQRDMSKSNQPTNMDASYRMAKLVNKIKGMREGITNGTTTTS
jgi:hypothetical protein|tara:strand:+ start:372 stop:593 length:222 start_codon:yes stop_codon:yes gene_type:complete